jgi:hypothetical protein
VPMHSHTNGQLNYVGGGTMHLITPSAAWVIPQQRIIWIPPGHPHSVRCHGLSGSWKIMTPQSYGVFLPKTVSVLQTSNLLVAALDALPVERASISLSKLRSLIEVIKHENVDRRDREYIWTMEKGSITRKGFGSSQRRLQRVGNSDRIRILRPKRVRRGVSEEVWNSAGSIFQVCEKLIPNHLVSEAKNAVIFRIASARTQA